MLEGIKSRISDNKLWLLILLFRYSSQTLSTHSTTKASKIFSNILEGLAKVQQDRNSYRSRKTNHRGKYFTAQSALAYSATVIVKTLM